MSNRAVIIGLDGVPHPLIERFAADGTMPNMAEILKTGTLRKMESAVPDISCVAWSTVITGKNPGEHGIYGFMNLAPGTYNFSFPNFNDLKAGTFWQEESSRRYAIINIPATYPAAPLNGSLISGFVSIDLGRATYPKSLIPELKKLDYRIDVDATKGHQDMDAFLKDLDETLESRIRTYRYLWNKEEWDTFFLVFTGTDRLGHFLFEAFEDDGHPYNGEFRRHFSRIDEIIGEINDRLGSDDLFMMLSDHGFGVIDREVNVNRFLQQEGFLRVANPKPGSFNGISDGTAAFALDPARIYVNLRGRYPKGCVDPADRDRIAGEVADAFEGLSIEGRPVARRICRRGDIYSGPCKETAPDLVILPHDGFDLKARLTAKELTSKGVFTGKHTQDDAFLFIRSPVIGEDQMPANPWVGDFRRIMESAI